MKKLNLKEKAINYREKGYSYNMISKITGVAKKQFGKTQIDIRINKSKTKRKSLPYGTLHLRIRSGGKKEFGKRLHRRIMGWIESITEQISACII